MYLLFHCIFFHPKKNSGSRHGVSRTRALFFAVKKKQEVEGGSERTRGGDDTGGGGGSGQRRDAHRFHYRATVVRTSSAVTSACLSQLIKYASLPSNAVFVRARRFPPAPRARLSVKKEKKKNSGPVRPLRR